MSKLMEAVILKRNRELHRIGGPDEPPSLLRLTVYGDPAMAAGSADHVLSLEEIVALLDTSRAAEAA